MAANTPSRGGLTPVRMYDGSPYNAGGATPCYVAAGAVATGDPVIQHADGSNPSKIVTGNSYMLGAEGMPAGSLRTVVKATNGATNRITGVITSVCANPTTTMTGIGGAIPSGSAGVVHVEMRQGVVYSVQSDGAGGVHSAADINQLANLTGSTYDTATGESVVKLDSASLGTTNTKQVRIVGVSTEEGKNDFAKDGVTFLVVLNLPSDSNDTAGV